MDWNNLDLERDREFALIDGMSIDHFLNVIVPSNVTIKSKRKLKAEFEERLQEIVNNARDVFNENLDNFVEYVNRDDVAEAVIADREAKDIDTVQQLTRDFFSNDRVWRQVSQECFDWMLECLPPIRQCRDGFMNSEPYTLTRDREEVYFVGLKANGDCYAVYGTLAEWDSKALDLMHDIPKW